ncbi:hypothetical protein C5167_000410 [Papaver somniferum]|uniref:non-specific serine/threonine protein kinase n=1 Tax=Papaver somniferum TaxID=3469 RepID=A0A4Y7KRG5_PAPSO|nr:L-type lectin-domain containing receptor kinase IV.1-like [Papaver somniferum]RZC75933.1 hypothetical protein C5167_000410 [Papaver somniferum]
MRTSFIKLVILFFLLLIQSFADLDHSDDEIYYNGFKHHSLKFDGEAQADLDTGLLKLTNYKKQYEQGHAFYSKSFHFKSNFSFSTTFVFAITSETGPSGQGMTFVIAPQRGLPGSLTHQFLGLFNNTNDGKSTNHVFAVELDGINNVEFDTVQGAHVGIDINSLRSVNSTSPGYIIDGEYKKLNLSSGEPMQVWVEYDGVDKQVSVTMAPVNISKPHVPLLLWHQNLSTIFLDSMYVGFSASTQTVLTNHYILGWSFQIDGIARPLNLSSLPKLPQAPPNPSPPPSPPPPTPLPPPPHPSPPLKPSNNRQIWVKIATAIAGSVLILAILAIFAFCYFRKHYRNKVPVRAPSPPPVAGLRKFSYSELEEATNVFREDIGVGAFGTVYRGVLPYSEIQVAVKKVSRDAKYGSKQFMAEIECLGNLRHRNVVHLHGYCEHEGQLLLVYDFMPNGSVEKFLYPKRNPLHCTLPWSQRFQIIKDIASGLYYLHKGWEQVVIHRDIKSSNVLLDSKMNARLGDFGLAKLYDHGADNSPTTRVVGTLGYIAPEMHYGMPSTQTDVYAFGAFLLEIACGRRPNLVAERGLHLVDWVLSTMKENKILSTVDKKLGGEYAEEEMLLVLKLGLMCCRLDPTARPSIQKILQFLSGDAAEADLRNLHMRDEAPFRYVGGGNTSPLSGAYSGSTSPGNDPAPSRQMGSRSSANEVDSSASRNVFTL